MSKRTMVTLKPEWGGELNKLKKDQFYDKTQAEMLRYVISRGLEVLRTERETIEDNSHITIK